MALILIAIISPLSQEPNNRYLTLYVGGTSRTQNNITPLRFLPDFRDNRILISDDSFACDSTTDCFCNKVNSKEIFYKGLKLKYYPADTSINLEKNRLPENSLFHYILTDDIGTDQNVVGLGRKSNFALNYLKRNKKGEKYFNIKLTDSEFLLYHSPQINLLESYKFDIYNDHNNQENFYLETQIQIFDEDKKEVFNLPVKLCPFSSPAFTDSRQILFSGRKSNVDDLRKTFEQYKDKLASMNTFLKIVSSESSLSLNNIFKKYTVSEAFSYSYSDSVNCDLYFGHKFIESFNIELIANLNDTEDAIDLYFNTHQPSPQTVGVGILFAALVVIILFFIFVCKSTYSDKRYRAEDVVREVKDALVA